AAGERSEIRNDRHHRSPSRRESMLRFQERRIHVLCAVSTETHARQEQDEVEKDLEVPSNRCPDLPPVLAMRPFPHFRLLHPASHEERQQRGYASDNEKRAPSEIRDDQEICS